MLRKAILSLRCAREYSKGFLKHCCLSVQWNRKMRKSCSQQRNPQGIKPVAFKKKVHMQILLPGKDFAFRLRNNLIIPEDSWSPLCRAARGTC